MVIETVARYALFAPPESGARIYFPEDLTAAV